MNELILHHYNASPFSEKVRLVLGHKGLAWKSVTVPVILPKPDVMALTGGYRRTPFLQIGADIYCDTALMCRVIDRLAPEPPLYPASAGATQHVIAQWADSALFWSAIPYTMQPGGAQHIFAGASPEVMKAFAADRAAMMAGVLRPNAADAQAQVLTYFGWLEESLADGRAFLCGEAACIADFSAAQSVWYIRRAPPVAAVLEPFTRLARWYERMKAFGHGKPEPMTGADAIGVARAATAGMNLVFDAGQGHACGDGVTITPTDYAQDPVAGRLVGLSNDEVAIERDDERAGRVVVHFPRIGFQIRKQDSSK
ncbi:glutathione S-transferase family protein [Piscinibacter sp.]|uniref:glutathione S-transferase family protein n=1 Tax=Piscinibacter sp. TaxID=1903157 RepID=UPI002CAC01D3|nr:glutathione S-transferase family protein [Albitalea sp.]HUG20942.1 glutathione S-transferase family protein [Albitalea sp.]